MSNVQNYHKPLYIIFRILIGIDIIGRSYTSTYEAIFFFFLFIIIMINEYLRIYHFYKNDKSYFPSMFTTMLISGIVVFHLGGYTESFIYMILYELIIFTDGKKSKILIILEIIFFFFIIIFRNMGIQYLWELRLIDIIMVLAGSFLFLIYILNLYTFKNLRKEKKIVENLNKELEEVTIIKERNRLAGEIHDNLGHNLVALNMNLDVASKMMDQDMDKARDLIHHSQRITKRSIEDLRMAVYALKEGTAFSLENAIKNLINNFQTTEEVKFVFEMDKKAETLLPNHKEIIHKSVKESITNSIKHGDPDWININIGYIQHELLVRVKDNGTGCDKLVKGNGLLGIEDRIEKIGGKVQYDFRDNFGFEIIFIFHLVGF